MMERYSENGGLGSVKIPTKSLSVRRRFYREDDPKAREEKSGGVKHGMRGSTSRFFARLRGQAPAVISVS
jgi:hypothetical protein